jgi:hypothetical protein
MHDVAERPNNWLERITAVITLAAVAAGGAWLGLRIGRAPGEPHPFEFMGLSMAALLVLYLAWLLWALATLRYTLHADRLLIVQGFRRTEVPLDGAVRLVRWRKRWSWAGHAQRDLGVGEVELYPPLWVGRSEATWVVCWQQVTGRRRAAAIRPSAALLAGLRELSRHENGLAG